MDDDLGVCNWTGGNLWVINVSDIYSRILFDRLFGRHRLNYYSMRFQGSFRGTLWSYQQQTEAVTTTAEIRTKSRWWLPGWP